jgi:hypothetical protein
MNLNGFKFKLIAELFDKFLSWFETSSLRLSKNRKNLKRAGVLMPLTLLLVLFQNCAPGGMKVLSSSGLSSKNQTVSAPTTTIAPPVYTPGPTPPVGAAVFYISPSGSDSRSCEAVR